jgi:translation initiation factor IF-1
MSQDKSLERSGIVVEALPNIMFRVKLDPVEAKEGEEQAEGEELISYLSGKMRLHRIRVLVGDKVLLELEPYGGKPRIIKRL